MLHRVNVRGFKGLNKEKARHTNLRTEIFVQMASSAKFRFKINSLDRFFLVEVSEIL